MITDQKKRDVALVVDDSPETLRLLTDALDGAGWDVFSSRPAPTRWTFARLAVRELLRR